MDRISLRFHTKYQYKNRQEKAKYVWLKYKSILNKSVLDVGADKGYLKSFLPNTVKYTTVGLEPFHDIKLDLEKEFPIESNSYNCVLSLDVLEHLERIHQCFDELCRVSSNYVIISLPNPWNDFMWTLKNGYYKQNIPIKFYNLSIEPPKDRHRWFFNASEARRFIEFRGKRNGMEILQIDQLISKPLKKKFYKFVLSIIVHKSISLDDLLYSTIWAVLKKKDQKN